MWQAWERREKCKRFLWESPKEIDYLEDEGVGVGIGSNWILGRLEGGLDSTGSGYGSLAICCECSDEPSDSCVTELVSRLGTSLC
jgi:hypothetical protein